MLLRWPESRPDRPREAGRGAVDVSIAWGDGHHGPAQAGRGLAFHPPQPYTSRSLHGRACSLYSWLCHGFSKARLKGFFRFCRQGLAGMGGAESFTGVVREGPLVGHGAGQDD